MLNPHAHQSSSGSRQALDNIEKGLITDAFGTGRAQFSNSKPSIDVQTLTLAADTNRMLKEQLDEMRRSAGYGDDSTFRSGYTTESSLSNVAPMPTLAQLTGGVRRDTASYVPKPLSSSAGSLNPVSLDSSFASNRISTLGRSSNPVVFPSQTSSIPPLTPPPLGNSSHSYGSAFAQTFSSKADFDDDFLPIESALDLNKIRLNSTYQSTPGMAVIRPQSGYPLSNVSVETSGNDSSYGLYDSNIRRDLETMNSNPNTFTPITSSTRGNLTVTDGSSRPNPFANALEALGVVSDMKSPTPKAASTPSNLNSRSTASTAQTYQVRPSPHITLAADAIASAAEATAAAAAHEYLVSLSRKPVAVPPPAVINPPPVYRSPPRSAAPTPPLSTAASDVLNGYQHYKFNAANVSDPFPDSTKMPYPSSHATVHTQSPKSAADAIQDVRRFINSTYSTIFEADVSSLPLPTSSTVAHGTNLGDPVLARSPQDPSTSPQHRKSFSPQFSESQQSLHLEARAAGVPTSFSEHTQSKYDTYPYEETLRRLGVPPTSEIIANHSYNQQRYQDILPLPASKAYSTSSSRNNILGFESIYDAQTPVPDAPPPPHGLTSKKNELTPPPAPPRFQKELLKERARASSPVTTRLANNQGLQTSDTPLRAETPPPPPAHAKSASLRSQTDEVLAGLSEEKRREIFERIRSSALLDSDDDDIAGGNTSSAAANSSTSNDQSSNGDVKLSGEPHVKFADKSLSDADIHELVGSDASDVSPEVMSVLKMLISADRAKRRQPKVDRIISSGLGNGFSSEIASTSHSLHSNHSVITPTGNIVIPDHPEVPTSKSSQQPDGDSPSSSSFDRPPSPTRPSSIDDLSSASNPASGDISVKGEKEIKTEELLQKLKTEDGLEDDEIIIIKRGRGPTTITTSSKSLVDSIISNSTNLTRNKEAVVSSTNSLGLKKRSVGRMKFGVRSSSPRSRARASSPLESARSSDMSESETESVSMSVSNVVEKEEVKSRSMRRKIVRPPILDDDVRRGLVQPPPGAAETEKDAESIVNTPNNNNSNNSNITVPSSTTKSASLLSNLLGYTPSAASTTGPAATPSRSRLRDFMAMDTEDLTINLGNNNTAVGGQKSGSPSRRSSASGMSTTEHLNPMVQSFIPLGNNLFNGYNNRPHSAALPNQLQQPYANPIRSPAQVSFGSSNVISPSQQAHLGGPRLAMPGQSPPRTSSPIMLGPRSTWDPLQQQQLSFRRQDHPLNTFPEGTNFLNMPFNSPGGKKSVSPTRTQIFSPQGHVLAAPHVNTWNSAHAIAATAPIAPTPTATITSNIEKMVKSIYVPPSLDQTLSSSFHMNTTTNSNANAPTVRSNSRGRPNHIHVSPYHPSPAYPDISCSSSTTFTTNGPLPVRMNPLGSPPPPPMLSPRPPLLTGSPGAAQSSGQLSVRPTAGSAPFLNQASIPRKSQSISVSVGVGAASPSLNSLQSTSLPISTTATAAPSTVITPALATASSLKGNEVLASAPSVVEVSKSSTTLPSNDDIASSSSGGSSSANASNSNSLLHSLTKGLSTRESNSNSNSASTAAAPTLSSPPPAKSMTMSSFKNSLNKEVEDDSTMQTVSNPTVPVLTTVDEPVSSAAVVPTPPVASPPRKLPAFSMAQLKAAAAQENNQSSSSSKDDGCLKEENETINSISPSSIASNASSPLFGNVSTNPLPSVKPVPKIPLRSSPLASSSSSTLTPTSTVVAAPASTATDTTTTAQKVSVVVPGKVTPRVSLPTRVVTPTVDSTSSPTETAAPVNSIPKVTPKIPIVPAGPGPAANAIPRPTTASGSVVAPPRVARPPTLPSATTLTSGTSVPTTTTDSSSLVPTAVTGPKPGSVATAVTPPKPSGVKPAPSLPAVPVDSVAAPPTVPAAAGARPRPLPPPGVKPIPKPLVKPA